MSVKIINPKLINNSPRPIFSGVSVLNLESIRNQILATTVPKQIMISGLMARKNVVGMVKLKKLLSTFESVKSVSDPPACSKPTQKMTENKPRIKI